MKIKSLEKILKKKHYFRPGWKPTLDGGFWNPKFGAVKHVVVCGDNGNQLYDQPEIEEVPGSIVVPHFIKNAQNYFGLVEINRPIIRDPETGRQGRVMSIEFPRGYANLAEGRFEQNYQTAIRELEEEMGKVGITGVIRLGSTNPQTTYFSNQKANEVYLIQIDPNSINKNAIGVEGLKDGIKGTRYVPEREMSELIVSNKIFCGATLAAYCLATQVINAHTKD